MIIKNATVCDAAGMREADIRIKNGLICEVGKNLNGEAKIIDAKGRIVLPGIIDLNVRTEDEQLSAQKIRQIAKEAPRGGVTTVVLMPDFKPPADNEIVLEFVKSQGILSGGAQIDLAILGVLKDDESKLSNVAILLKRGAIAPYCHSGVESNILRRLCEYTRMYNVPLFCLAEDRSISDNGVMHEGFVSARLGLKGIPSVSESAEVARVIELAKFFGVRVVFKSLSSYRSVELIQKAKSEGVEVYAEVSIHHLLVTDEACENFNTLAKIKPPLRDEDNRARLLRALASGQIDFLTSLHSPRSSVYKDVAFDEAAFGTTAISHFFALCYDRLVGASIIGLPRLSEILSLNPARLLGRNKGMVAAGYEADLIIVDPSGLTTVEEIGSLYFGQKLASRVERVIRGGEVI